MNQRNVCIVGLAAVATLLSGCAAQYGNPSACVTEMRSRLDKTSTDQLKITHRATSYRGQRVVIEGQLERASAPAAASAPAVAPSPQPKPTTPVARLLARFPHTQQKTMPAAAECTFDKSGMTSFRWLAPPVLAKTTPAPTHTN
jgi:hypothetical protein